MATYDDWNNAIVDYITSGAPSGSTIYLSVDTVAELERIGVYENSG
jgi:hypothetical protein